MVGVNRALACFLLVLGVASQSVIAGKTPRCAGRKVLGSGIPCDVRNEIVRIHNEHRQQLKNGGRLRQLYWDNALAKKAQALTDGCRYKYDIGPNYDDRFNVSQSIGYSSNDVNSNDNKNLGFPERIEDWLNKDKLAESPLSPRNNSDTYLIGCGYTRYQRTHLKATSFYVCNYAPSPVMHLEHEAAASECLAPLKNSNDYPGLCGMEEPPNEVCVDEGLNGPDEEFDQSNLPATLSTIDYEEVAPVPTGESQTNNEKASHEQQNSDNALKVGGDGLDQSGNEGVDTIVNKAEGAIADGASKEASHAEPSEQDSSEIPPNEVPQVVSESESELSEQEPSTGSETSEIPPNEVSQVVSESESELSKQEPSTDSKTSEMPSKQVPHVVTKSESEPPKEEPSTDSQTSKILNKLSQLMNNAESKPPKQESSTDSETDKILDKLSQLINNAKPKPPKHESSRDSKAKKFLNKLSQLLNNAKDKSSSEVSSPDSAHRDYKSNVHDILDKTFQQIGDPKTQSPKNSNPITINIFEL